MAPFATVIGIALRWDVVGGEPARRGRAAGIVSVHDRYLARRYGAGYGSSRSDLGDLFAINPIRRSFGAIVVCALLIVLPLLTLQGEVRMAVEIVTGWFGLTGLIICLPVFLWSVAEEGWRLLERRLWPTIEELDLSPRAHNLLRRHGYVTIVSVERTSDTSLLLLSNMDNRALHEIRRGISLWRYRRWQERGFRDAAG